MKNLIKCNMSQDVTISVSSNMDKMDQDARPSIWTFYIGRGLTSKDIEIRITDGDMSLFVAEMNKMSPYSIINFEISKDKLLVYRGISEILLNKKMSNPIIDQNPIHLTAPIRGILAQYYLDLSMYAMTESSTIE